MNKRIKVLVAAVLATVMVCLCIPFSAAAAGATSLEVGKGYTISAVNGKGTIYVTGSVNGGRFDGVYDAANATVFYVEAATNAGEYLLYFLDGTTKTYVIFGDKTSQASTTTVAAEATPFEWNTDKKTLAVAEDSNNRGFGVAADSTYDNFSSYDLSGEYNWGEFNAVAGSTTPDPKPNPGTGDSTAAYVALAAVALFGIAYVSKKH